MLESCAEIPISKLPSGKEGVPQKQS